MKENRKHVRVKIPHDITEWTRLLGAKAHWPSHEQVEVYDLAYKGAAVGTPAIFTAELDQKIKIKFSLNPYGDIDVGCRIAWKTEQRLGLEFEQMSAEAKQRLDQYLDHKLIGQNLKPVDKRHFHSSADFTDWFMGPHDTHVFLWRGGTSEINKAIVETDFGSVEFNGTSWIGANKDFLIRISDILSQIPQAEHPLKELAKSLPKELTRDL